MTNQSPKAQLAALYEKKRQNGLVDVRFDIDKKDEASFDDVAVEVLRLEESIEQGNYRVIRFDDIR